MKYLVRTAQAVGDVAVDIAMLNAIARLDPECHLEVLAKPPFDNLLSETPFIDKLHVRPQSFIADLRLQKKLLADDWDVVLSTRNAGMLQPFYHFAKAKYKKSKRYMAFPDGITGMQLSVSMLDGILPGWNDLIDPTIHFNTKRLDEIVSKLDLVENSKLLTIQPGASVVEKYWGKEKYVALINKISSGFDSTLILGSKSEHELCEYISNNTTAANVAGTMELLDVYALMTITTLHVGNDSGLGHLAAAAGTKCLAIGGKIQFTPWQQHMLNGDVKTISLEEVLTYLRGNNLSQTD